jgi:hypothetical protein
VERSRPRVFGYMLISALSPMASNLEEWLRHEGRGLRAVPAGRSTDVATHHRLKSMDLIPSCILYPWVW